MKQTCEKSLGRPLTFCLYFFSLRRLTGNINRDSLIKEILKFIRCSPGFSPLEINFVVDNRGKVVYYV